MIAPIIVTVLILFIAGGYASVWLFVASQIPAGKFLGAVVFLMAIASGLALMAVLRSRIKEIQGGETDDLDQY